MKLLLLSTILLLISGCNFYSRTNYRSEDYTKCISYSEFIQAVKDEEILRVLFRPYFQTHTAVDINGIINLVNLDPDLNLVEILQENNVDIAVEGADFLSYKDFIKALKEKEITRVLIFKDGFSPIRVVKDGFLFIVVDIDIDENLFRILEENNVEISIEDNKC